jgi:hypothetical protein
VERQNDQACPEVGPRAHARGGQGHAELREDLCAQRQDSRAESVRLSIEVRFEISAHLDAPRDDHRHERRLARTRSLAAGALLRGRLRRRALRFDALGPGSRATDEQQRRADHQERRRRQPGDGAEEQHEHACHLERFRHAEKLSRELLAERSIRLLACHAGHEHAGSSREDERRDLSDQAVADREQAVALERVHGRHPLHADADGEPSEEVHDEDDERRDDVALHEFHRAVHGAVELALSLQQSASSARFVAVDGSPAELRVDGHLLSGHRVEGEPRADLGHALGALGDDDELDDRQDEEDDCSHDVVAADDERPERLDDLPRVGLEQDETRGGNVQRKPKERRQQEQGRERGNADGVRHVEDDEEDGDRG